MKNIEDLSLGIIGATGLVGKQVIEILEQRELLPQNIRLAASKNSAGQTLSFMGKDIDVEELTDGFFDDVDVAICSAGSSVSEAFLTQDNLQKCLVIDNCSYFRMDPDVPLVIPEINAFALEHKPSKSIIANPNCTTIAMLMALGYVHQRLPIQSIVCSSYQSVSGAGAKAITEMTQQIQDLFQSGSAKHEVFDHRIAFNCLPVIGSLDAEGVSQEEQKMQDETKKILEDEIVVNATCVRVPTFVGHGLSLFVETQDPVDLTEVREILTEAQGIKLIDAPKGGVYPILSDCQGQDDVYVGRLRKGHHDRSLMMWLVSDNIRKGAALNAVQILEDVIARPWF